VGISRILDDYRQHTILSAKHEGKFCGRVWKEKALLHETEGTSVENMLVELKKFVDEKLEGTALAAGSTPDETRVIAGLREICTQLSDGQLAMLRAHYHAENQAITASEFAAAAGYASYHPANLHYGNIGKLLYEMAPIKLNTYKDGTPIYTFYLATELTKTEDEQHWRWKLRPEVSNAIKALGLDT
jgi:hypothetical protein